MAIFELVAKEDELINKMTKKLKQLFAKTKAANTYVPRVVNYKFIDEL